MKQYSITIKADTNDADYITETSKISEEDLNALRPLITAIKNFKPYGDFNHNFPANEYTNLGEKTVEELYPDHLDALEIFDGCRPYGEYGIHTIKSVTVTPHVEQEKLL